MNVTVMDLSANQKKLQVEIPAEEVNEELEKRYKELAKRLRIKGFRPGKAPRSILKSYYGKSVASEVSSQFVQDTFPKALREVDLKPLTEADIDEMHFADDGAFTYSAVVEVCPPFELQGYKGMELQRAVVQVSEETIDTELERIRQQHAQLRTLEADRAIQENDVVLIDYTPSIEGSVVQKGKTQDQMIEIGKGALHPEFDRHLIGHRPDDAFAFGLDYPQDAVNRELAGKRVHFDVTVKEIKQKVVPDLSDELAQEVGQFETLEDLKQEIRSQLEKREEEAAEEGVHKQIIEQLLAKAEFELSPKVVDSEVDHLIGLLQRQFESQGLKIDTARFDTPAIRAEYRPQAEKNVRWRLISEQVAKQENIELSDEELDAIYHQVARLLRMDVETLKEEYAESRILGQARDGKLQEKVFKFIEEEAVYITTPEEGQHTGQE
jgi:trigger factor